MKKPYSEATAAHDTAQEPRRSGGQPWGGAQMLGSLLVWGSEIYGQQPGLISEGVPLACKDEFNNFPGNGWLRVRGFPEALRLC